MSLPLYLSFCIYSLSIFSIHLFESAVLWKVILISTLQSSYFHYFIHKNFLLLLPEIYYFSGTFECREKETYYMWTCSTPLLNPKKVYKKILSKRPMGYDKGVLWEFKTGFIWAAPFWEKIEFKVFCLNRSLVYSNPYYFFDQLSIAKRKNVLSLITLEIQHIRNARLLQSIWRFLLFCISQSIKDRSFFLFAIDI